MLRGTYKQSKQGHQDSLLSQRRGWGESKKPEHQPLYPTCQGTHTMIQCSSLSQQMACPPLWHILTIARGRAFPLEPVYMCIVFKPFLPNPPPNLQTLPVVIPCWQFNTGLLNGTAICWLEQEMSQRVKAQSLIGSFVTPPRQSAGRTNSKHLPIQLEPALVTPK